jgi:hypothetical protein
MKWQATTDPSPPPRNVTPLTLQARGWHIVTLPSTLEFPNLPPGSDPIKDVYAHPIYKNSDYPFRTTQVRAGGGTDTVIDDMYNPHAMYWRAVLIPKEWNGMRVFLHIGSVRSAAHVWVNGQLVGCVSSPPLLDVNSNHMLNSAAAFAATDVVVAVAAGAVVCGVAAAATAANHVRLTAADNAASAADVDALACPTLCVLAAASSLHNKLAY